MLQKIPTYWAALLMLAVFLPSCAIQKDQFGHAVMTSNVHEAQKHIAPKYARMTIHETNGKYSVPIQYAIVHRNKDMASFLVQNDCHRNLDGQNLTYYCARNGYPDMARHFASLGEGSYSDIDRAQRDAVREREQSRASALIGLAFLATLLSAGSGSSGGGGGYDHLNGRSVQDAAAVVQYQQANGI